ncbi:MAG TPA: hypothetical protein VHY31_14535 [Streptosporangiaceae bacterium]|nr:hypothetical protein [Streptosporangiaceae bacterium]
MTGTGLLSAAALGGAFGWTGPMAYWLATESVLAAHWTTPWIWPAGRRTTAARPSAPRWCSPPGSRPSPSSARETPAAALPPTEPRNICSEEPAYRP